MTQIVKRKYKGSSTLENAPVYRYFIFINGKRAGSVIAQNAHIALYISGYSHTEYNQTVDAVAKKHTKEAAYYYGNIFSLDLDHGAAAIRG